MEGDSARLLRARAATYFNPLPPHGGRHAADPEKVEGVRISIHSLRMEGDYTLVPNEKAEIVFQSTPSAWRETSADATRISSPAFQSTPSAWRETGAGPFQTPHNAISIHSLRMEGDQARPARSCQALHFNPLPPHGGRLVKHFFCFCGLNISIHSLRMEGD